MRNRDGIDAFRVFRLLLKSFRPESKGRLAKCESDKMFSSNPEACSAHLPFLDKTVAAGPISIVILVSSNSQW